MTHFRQYFDSEYLGSWDLVKGRDHVVVIDRIQPGTLVGQKGRKDKKALIQFRGKKKLMAANVTNCKLIAGIYGNDTRNWVGKPIALYVAENVDSPNGPVDAIRVRPRAPQMPGAKPAPPPPPSSPPNDEERVPWDGVEDENPGPDHWSNVLGVALDATRAQIKTAYRALVKKHHPDTGGDAGEFQRIQDAFMAAMSRFDDAQGDDDAEPV